MIFLITKPKPYINHTRVQNEVQCMEKPAGVLNSFYPLCAQTGPVVHAWLTRYTVFTNSDHYLGGDDAYATSAAQLLLYFVAAQARREKEPFSGHTPYTALSEQFYLTFLISKVCSSDHS